MPLTWYNLGDGPAPWADATSFSSSSVSSTFNTFAGANELAGTTFSSESFEKDQDSASYRLDSLSATNSATGVSASFSATQSFATGTGNTKSGGLSSGYGTYHGSTGTTSGATGAIYTSGATYAREERATAEYMESVVGGVIHWTSSASYSSSSLYNDTRADVYFDTGIGTSAVSTTANTDGSSGEISGITTGSRAGAQSAVTAYGSVSTTQVKATTVVSSYVVSTYSVDGYSYSEDSYTYEDGGSTLTQDSVSYTEDGYTSADGGERFVTSVSGSSTITTFSGTSTGTSSYAYPTTTYSIRSYTGVTTSGSSATTSTLAPQTATYLPGSHHLIPVVSALAGEVLRIQSATSTGITDLGALLGASFTQSTLGAALYSGSDGTPTTSSVPTRTVTYFSTVFTTVTITRSTTGEVSITDQSFNGWVGGTATEQRVLRGASSTTATQRSGSMVTASSTKTGARSSISYQLIELTELVEETVTGIAASGASSSYRVDTPYTVPGWTTCLDWVGKQGDTVTTFRSPAGNALAAEGAGTAVLQRIERSFGYQSPTAMGSAGVQGRSLTANSSFFIGPRNLGTASPNDLRTPILSAASTASTSNSLYSFSIGTHGSWDVSASRSETTVLTTTNGTSTGTVSSVTGTLVTFTATVTAAAPADAFASASPQGVIRTSITLAGGAHAHTGGDQHATLSGGWGWRYTEGDSAGTSSNKTLLPVPYTTISLGSNILAAETFRAGLASPAVSPGLPTVNVFAYSAP